MLLFILSVTIHMRIGNAGDHRDYVHAEKQKLTLLILNNLYAVAIGLACASRSSNCRSECRRWLQRFRNGGAPA